MFDRKLEIKFQPDLSLVFEKDVFFSELKCTGLQGLYSDLLERYYYATNS